MTDGGSSDWETRLVEAIDRRFGGNRSAFARAVGVSYRTVARWCSGEARPQRESRGLVAAQGDEFAALVAELEEPQPRTPSLAMRRLEDEVRDLRETVRQLEGQGRFLPAGEPGEYLSPEELAELREEGIGAEEGYGRTIRTILRTLAVVERRLRRLERLLPGEERGHG